MIVSARARRRSTLARATGTVGLGALACGLVAPVAAFAQCTPDPTVANSTTTCTGTDANGIRVTTSGTTLAVAAGATVTNTGAPAIAVDAPRSSSTSYASNAINVSGTVSATGQNAITVSSGTPYASGSYTTQYVTLTVGANNGVTGSTALALLQSAGNANGTVSATVDNAGTLTGTSGIALSGNVTTTSSGYTSALTSFSSITNRAGGSIVGGILGSVYSLGNSGTIDGGANSALGSSITSPNVNNMANAAIRSSSTAATILAPQSGSLTLTNAGTVANAGTGAAVSGGTVTLTNQAGAQISSAGATAIAAATALTLTNAGTVTGNVATGSGASTVDSTSGTINGSVTFGSGNDTLVARYAGSRTLATGITGGVNGGGGTNAERVVFAADASVAGIDLDTNFQQLVLAPAARVTVTLQTGFAASTSNALVLSGQGTVVNRTNLSVTGQAVTDTDYGFGSAAAFRNEGSITSTLPSGSSVYGLTLSNHSFTNTGSVSVTGGGGLSMSYNPVVNSGSITAANTALYLFDGVLTNNAGGSIVSTAGTGINLYGNVGYTGSNAGTIRGATTGAITSIYLTNTGTIGSAGVGVAVQGYGYLINAAGGVVNGGTGGAATVGSFNAGIANAGTINGNVAYSGDNSLNYIALPGGVLNGNLSLGGGTLVTSLNNTGTGQFAGITGTVTATGGAALRYAVDADASATLPAAGVGPFTNVGYQLANNASLTITTPAGQTRAQTLTLAGNGSVDLTAAIATTGVPAIQSTSAITYPGASATAAGGLSITSRGALAVTRTSSSTGYYNGAVVLSSGDSFTNAGSIVVTDRSGSGLAAISGGSSAANNGQITLDGGVGISGTTSVTNAGTITQASGGAASRGVTGFASLNNTGTISVGGTAAQISYIYSTSSGSAQSISNSGTLASTVGIAISEDSYVYQQPTITNQAGGTISGVGRAVQVYAATLTNAGTITGTVDLGYAPPSYSGAAAGRSGSPSTYVAAGGTIAGDLLFGSGGDLLLQTGDALGVSGTIDGGAGTDIYGRVLSATGSAAIDPAGLKNFEDALIQAKGTGTVATATATGTFAGNLYAVGNGSVVNQASVAGMLMASVPSAASAQFSADQNALAALTNAGSVAGGVSGTVPSFTNTGTIGSASLAAQAVSLSATGAMTFANSGTISSNPALGGTSFYFNPNTISLRGSDSITATNSGTINAGGLYANTLLSAGTPGAVTLDNSGTITSSYGRAAATLLLTGSTGDVGGTITLNNSGTIDSQGSSKPGYITGEATGAYLGGYSTRQPVSYMVTNTGTISARAVTPALGFTENVAYALEIVNNSSTTAQVSNGSTGVITAIGPYAAYAISTGSVALNLVNAGTITASGGTTSVAVQTFGSYADSVRNTGTITGDIVLAAGADTVDNAGTITGKVSLGDGNDTFIGRAGGTVSGVIDGGAGTNAYVLDATGGTATLAASGIANFASVTQTGTGTGSYSGSFGVGTINLAGGTLAVAAGQTLATAGGTTITGAAGGGALTIANSGTIAGGITLADGNDTVVNNGAIGGAVQLGTGDDTYVEGVGSSVGSVDGGGGTNLYRVMLAGNRTGIGPRSGFQNLAVDGSGTLSLALDQNFGTVTLNGTGLALASGAYSVGQIVAAGGTGVGVSLDRDVAVVQLGSGGDTLVTTAQTLAGRYDGGAGSDTLRLANTGPVTIAGSVTGFETVSLAGSALTVSGTLGTAGTATAMSGGDKSLTVARGGTLAGTIDLGAGNDSFRLAAGGVLNGTVSGGAGANTATLDLSAGDFTLRAGTLTSFARLATEGAGTLTLAGSGAGGALAYGTTAIAGNLSVAADASLASAVVFGAGDNRLAIAGGFAGSVDGGAGNDGIDVSGGSAAAPVAFSSVSSIEAYRQGAGFATVSGTAALGTVAMTGGRFVGLAGSTIAAGTITVGQAATFGSAGTVNGNVAVAGTLSPGASPGTMTVNGNVSLGATSVSVFEITPAVSDKLVVNGAVSIASGATLQLVPSAAVTPGSTLDLVTATGGITGSFTAVVKPASLFGFVVQDAQRIRLLGQFQTDPGFSPQVGRAVDYVNGVLTSGQSSAALLAAVPALATGGITNAAAFAQLTPEPYAAARQIGVDNGLSLADAARGAAFAPARDMPGLFTFGSATAGTRTLGVDTARGTAATTTNGYGFLGGIGYAGAGWSVGAFGGWLHDRQMLSGLGARTVAEGAVAGAHARLDRGGFALRATVAYDDARATTRRSVTGGSASGRYDLHGWTADASLSYALPMGAGWSARPAVGATAIRTTRGGLAETGGSAFALTVARDRETAVFVDGGATFAREGGTVRPYLTLGARYQAQGRAPYAVAGLGGGGIGLLAAGATRAPVLATATLGADAALTPRLSLFGALTGESGDADHRAAARAGLRLAF